MGGHRYERFRAGGLEFPGLWPLLAAAERGGRDGAVTVYGGIRIGASLGWETIGELVRKGGAVEFEGLEPAEGGGS